MIIGKLICTGVCESPDKFRKFDYDVVEDYKGKEE